MTIEHLEKTAVVLRNGKTIIGYLETVTDEGNNTSERPVVFYDGNFYRNVDEISRILSLIPQHMLALDNGGIGGVVYRGNNSTSTLAGLSPLDPPGDPVPSPDPHPVVGGEAGGSRRRRLNRGENLSLGAIVDDPEI